jgi:hypothetical protein
VNRNAGAPRNILTVDPEDGVAVLKGLASPVRLRILRLLHGRGPMNVNEISAALKLPQSWRSRWPQCAGLSSSSPTSRPRRWTWWYRRRCWR